MKTKDKHESLFFFVISY